MNLYAIIIDVIVVIVFFLAIRSSFRSGFLRSIVMLVGSVAALILANKLGQMLSVHIYEQFMYEKIVVSINDAVTQGVQGIDISAIANAIVAAIPSSLLALFGGQKAIQNALSGGTDSLMTGTGDIITTEVVTPIILPLLQTVLCVILFLILLVVVNLIAGIFKGFYAIPIIGPINSFLGGVIGLLQGAVIVWFLALIVTFVISVTKGDLFYLNNDIVGATYIFKRFF